MLIICYISVIYLLSFCYISDIYPLYICYISALYVLYIISLTSIPVNARYFFSPCHIMRCKFCCDFLNVFVTVSTVYIASLYTHTMLCVCLCHLQTAATCSPLPSPSSPFIHSLPSAFSHICPMILCAFDIYLHKCNV